MQVFAPTLWDQYDPPGPYPTNTLIPLTRTVYKCMQDFYNESNGALPTLPALGGEGWRGAPEVVVLSWNYAALLNLHSSMGMEVRIYLEHHTPFTGTYATATVYGLSEDE